MDLENPTGDDIARRLRDLPIDPAYEAVLSSGDSAFIQARGEGLEEARANGLEDLMLHALDGAEHMYESAERHPVNTVIRLFQLYAQGSPQWKQEIEWKEFQRLGPKVWILGAVVAGAFLLWLLLR